MKIEITKNLSDRKKEKLDIANWPIWEKEASQFPWRYEDRESCLILEGKVTVKTAEETVSFGPGDFVVFPAGLDCEWIIEENVRKHYNFG